MGIALSAKNFRFWN